MSLLKSFAALLIFSSAAVAQTGRVYTASDYARAEKFMAYNVNSLVLHGVSDPQWLPDGRVWYRDEGTRGESFILVDPVKGTKAPAFDQVKMASALEDADRRDVGVRCV